MIAIEFAERWLNFSIYVLFNDKNFCVIKIFIFVSCIWFVSSVFSSVKIIVSNFNVIVFDDYFMNSFCFSNEKLNVRFWYCEFIWTDDVKFSFFYIVKSNMIWLLLFKNNFDVKFVIFKIFSLNWNFIW